MQFGSLDVDKPVKTRVRRSVSRAEVLVLVSAILATVGVATLWISSSYFGVTPGDSLSFMPNDGWCDPSVQGLGNHCWGDYASVSIWKTVNYNPWTRDWILANYPPTAWIPAGLAAAIGSLLPGERWGLAIYLLAAITCLAAPAFWVAGRAKLTRLPIALLLLFALAGPVLNALDRGNSIAFAVPLLLLLVWSISHARWNWAVTAVVLLALVKPQFLLFAVLLLANRRYWRFVVSVVSAPALIVASFVVLPGFPGNFTAWLNSLSHFSTAMKATEGYPTNLGIGRSLITLSDLVGIGELPGARAALGAWLDTNGTLIAVLAVAAVFGVVALAGQRLPLPWALALVSYGVIYASATTFGYYLVLFVVVAATIIRDPRLATQHDAPWTGSLDDLRPTVVRSRLDWLVVITTALALAPIAIPSAVLDAGMRAHLQIESNAIIYQRWLGGWLLLAFLVMVGQAARVGITGSLLPALRTAAQRRRDSLHHVA